jgi:hypothetical protein
VKELQNIFITDENRKWIETLKAENIFKLRKLLKKERDRLPNQYRRLYLADEEKLTDFMYTLILYGPGLTHLKAKARNYFRAKNSTLTRDIKNCGSCKWFIQPPPTEENKDIKGEDRFKSCQQLGALEKDISCEGFEEGDTHEQKTINRSYCKETQNHESAC